MVSLFSVPHEKSQYCGVAAVATAEVPRRRKREDSQDDAICMRDSNAHEACQPHLERSVEKDGELLFHIFPDLPQNVMRFLMCSENGADSNNEYFYLISSPKRSMDVPR